MTVTVLTEIMEMIDQAMRSNQPDNAKLERKKREFIFINRLSEAVGYDRDWDQILPKILAAGLSDAIDVALFGILYRIDKEWRLSLYLPGKEINKGIIDRLKLEIVKRYNCLSRDTISSGKVIHRIYPGDLVLGNAAAPPISGEISLPLETPDRHAGLLFLVPKKGAECTRSIRPLAAMMADVLGRSLQNVRDYHLLKKMAFTDGLTGVFNRQAMREFLEREFGRSLRYQSPLSLIMIDVNDFKSINDSLGHQAGDYVLCEVACCLSSVVRKSDFVVRYGGDEFAVILPETNRQKAESLVHRILDAVCNRRFVWHGTQIDVQLSYGTATTTELTATINEQVLLKRADERLYEGKKNPRMVFSA